MLLASSVAKSRAEQRTALIGRLLASATVDTSIRHDRLDFGCTTLAGLRARQLNSLQSVLSAAVRLVYSARRSEHVSTSSTGCASQSGLTSASPFSFIVVSTVQRHVTSPVSFCVCARHRHRRCLFHGRCTRPLATVHSLSPPQKSGSSCRRRSRHCRHCTHSSVH